MIACTAFICCSILCVMLCTSDADGQMAPATSTSHPDVPYLAKPATRPMDWIVEHEPVTPQASPEARALLKFLYQISGKHTLSGQHNYPNEQEYSTQLARQSAHKTPAIYGTDFGFAKRGDKDSTYVRGEMVQELIKQHRDGSIITICWHAVRPIEDEPVTFRHHVQGKLTNEEFEDLLTPGTAIHARWCAQVDAIAVYLKQLQAARVPILWRPYHEMNGDWFWWGGRRGERGTKQLYRQIFDRLVNHHHLTNLIWVWNIDRPSREDRQFVDYFPGQQFVDVLALDDYHDYQQDYYDDLNALSDGKVLAISECGQPPTPDIYKTQPKWTWWMPWAKDRPRAVATQNSSSQPATTQPVAPALGFGPPGSQPAKPKVPMSEIVKDPRIFNLEDDAYRQAITDYRAACGLPPLARSSR